MSNAALYFHPNAYDTAGSRLLGRHSAGESFLRGFLRHAEVDAVWLYNVTNGAISELEPLLARIEAPRSPVKWVGFANRPGLSEVGVLHLPVPEISTEAWNRRLHGEHLYAICGITHTTATANVMRILPDLMIAPLRDYDALICTSTAVRDSTEAQISLMREYVVERFGVAPPAEPTRVTIPLGLNTSDFASRPDDRAAWRQRLGISDDAIVALYVGRFNVRGKMNPALMARALERAAVRSGKPIHWVNSGWAETEKDELQYHEESRKLCPSVTYHAVDGRELAARFTIWSVADLFISFSDNIQETFGLTPIEAMAAGLPCIVSDWDGYKDTVRDGIDGFRITTTAPRPGLGNDFAYWFANNLLSYDHYVGGTAQAVTIDYGEAEHRLVSLINNPDLRRQMGEAARVRARNLFDWAAIIPQYQALWAEQNARRLKAPAVESRINPYRPDPYRLFAKYPTRHLRRSDTVGLLPGVSWEAAKARLDAPLAVYSRFNRSTHQELELVFEFLLVKHVATVAELLELVPAPRRNILERSLLWLARHDLVHISRRPG